jgi:hypothetical protein
MSQLEPELKVIEQESWKKLLLAGSASESKIEPKVNEQSSTETYLKPKRDRSPKQIEWSRELGKRSKEFKIKKKGGKKL